MLKLPTERLILGIPGTLFFGLLLLFAVVAFVYSASRRIRVLMAGAPEPRFDRIGLRIRRTLEYAFAQKRMFRDFYAGVFHILIFGGFVVLTVRTVELVVVGLFPGFDLLPGMAGNLYTLAKDAFEVLVLVGIAMAVYRRAFARPARLDLTVDAWVVLFLIALLIAADLVAEGARVAAEPALASRWSPAVDALARGMAGFSPRTLQGLFEWGWWTHLAVILFFLNYLPYSKHFHILTAVPNIFFMKLDPPGRLATPDLEKSERFGASRVEDLTWKSMLDGYACTECGRCREVCPTVLTQKPLDPRLFIAAVRDAVYEATPAILAEASGRGNGSAGHGRRDLIGGWISEETIWACTTCGFCTSACPVFIIPAVDKIVEMRRHLVLDKAEFPKEMQTAFRGMETNGNPWGMAAAARADWAKDLPVVTMAQAQGKDIEVLFWVGCAGSYEDRAKKVSRALVEMLSAAGVSFAILGTEETCNGDSARRMGNEYLFQILAQQNVETLNGYGVRSIVTNCPHCFNVIRNEYPDFGGELRGDARHRARGEADRAGPPPDGERRPGVDHVPRPLLPRPLQRRLRRAAPDPRGDPGLRLQELPRSRERGLCCGAGGGRMWMEEKLGSRINQTRMKEIAEAGTDAVGVSCPFCMVMIGNAKEEIGASTQPFDVLELARRSMA